MNKTIFHITAQLLAEKLQFVTAKPREIVVFGSDYASTREVLSKLYSAALMELDVNDDRHLAAKKNNWLSGLLKKNYQFQVVDWFSLPKFNQGQYDLVVSNLYLARLANQKKSIMDLAKKLLKSDGLLFFSFLGLDSFKEIYHLFGRQVGDAIPCYQMDMHDVGDELLRVGFQEPVMSMDLLTLTYTKTATLLKDLTALGVLPSLLSWLNVSAQEFENSLRNHIELAAFKFRVSYEFIFAHAINKYVESLSFEQEVKFYSS